MENKVRNLVFVSYSREDKRWLGELQKHLKPYLRQGAVTAWDDTQIKPGSKWLALQRYFLLLRWT